MATHLLAEDEHTPTATNETVSAKAVRDFYHGRGAQEKRFGEAKQHAALDITNWATVHR